MEPSGDEEFEADPEGGSVVSQLADLATEVMVDNACPLSVVKGELPDGTTVCVAVGIYRAGEWLNNVVGAECDRDDEEGDPE